MNVIIIGAGRMGIRHAQGISTIDIVKKIHLVDINQSALDNAKNILQGHSNIEFKFLLLKDVKTENTYFDIGVLASTANNRGLLYNLLVNLGCRHILAEKPLGQSYSEVLQFNNIVEKSGIPCYVNLNMRLQSTYTELHNDINQMPQLQGKKTITLNTGSLGIGANGIHYLDMLFFLLDADDSQIIAAEIEDTLIPSGRGIDFGDFGGWCVIDFYKKRQNVGKALLSMSASSTAFGSWDILGSHGRIYLNEVEKIRIDTLRKPDSTMPINRYFADYLDPVETKLNSPALSDLTAKWLISLLNGQSLLPTITDSIKVHALMFDWLSHSKTYKRHFPIT